MQESPETKSVIKLARIADEINSKAGETLRLASDSMRSGRAAIAAAVATGKLLIKAKQIVGHGCWLKWLDDNCPHISEATSQRLMRLGRANPSLLTDLDNSKTIQDAYRIVGILPPPKQITNGIGTADVNLWDRFSIHFNRLNSLLDGVSMEEAPPEARQQIKEQLRPLVEFYESL